VCRHSTGLPSAWPSRWIAKAPVDGEISNNRRSACVGTTADVLVTAVQPDAGAPASSC